jgi:general secretion pathway protein C
MSADALLRKYFPLLVLALLGIAVYLQASGIGHLFAAALAPSAYHASASGGRPQAAADVEAGRPPERKRADAILERNPFDSVTGPLGQTPAPVELAPTIPPNTDPLAAPACEGIRLRIVTEAEDPTRSIAALSGGEAGPERVYRVGDSVGGRTIAYIGYNAREQSPAVWLTTGDTLCQALLFKDAPNAPAPPPAPEPEPEAKADAPRGLTDVSPALASRIRQSKVGVVVDKGAVDEILADRTQLMPAEKILPEQWQGEVIGIRIFGIGPDTLLAKLGFHSGDRLESINGVKIRTPDQARDAWEALRQGSLTFEVQRRGKAESFTVEAR